MQYVSNRWGARGLHPRVSPDDYWKVQSMPWKTSDFNLPDRPVEQATAAPGEKRDVMRIGEWLTNQKGDEFQVIAIRPDGTIVIKPA